MFMVTYKPGLYFIYYKIHYQFIADGSTYVREAKSKLLYRQTNHIAFLNKSDIYEVSIHFRILGIPIKDE